MKKLLLLILFLVLSCTIHAQEFNPYTVEYYYKVKWGYFNEFLELYKKNHYPILKELKDRGQILEMEAAFPINHAPETARWDFRFTIVFKDYAASRNQALSDSIAQKLYPDWEQFQKEERRRFEILLEHMDIPIRKDDQSNW
jgi:hypothetical protein